MLTKGMVAAGAVLCALVIAVSIPYARVTDAQGNTDPPFVFPPAFECDLILPEQIKIAVIGDFGMCSTEFPENCNAERAVAAAVTAADPDYVITVGDNNLESGCRQSGAQGDLDANIEGTDEHPLFADFFESGRFWPSLGNHDYKNDVGVCNDPNAGHFDAKPYLDYFQVDQYYAVDLGLVSLYALDSNQADDHEPRGASLLAQKDQLASWLAESQSCWNMAFFHHPPYSRGEDHGDHPAMQQPTWQWDTLGGSLLAPVGVEAVFSGHDHIFAWMKDAINSKVDYFVTGIGGQQLKGVGRASAGQVRLEKTGEYGFMLVTVSRAQTSYDLHLVGRQRPEGWGFVPYESVSVVPVTTVTPPAGRPQCQDGVNTVPCRECEVTLPQTVGTWNEPCPGWMQPPTTLAVVYPRPDFECESDSSTDPENSHSFGPRITVEFCCARDGGTGCVMKRALFATLRAYDRAGNLMYVAGVSDPDVVMDQNYFVFTPHYGPSLYCLFHSSNPPVRWEVELHNYPPDHVYSITSVNVEYYCCKNCGRIQQPM